MRELVIGDNVLALGARTRVVGIFNATPDSFSDGGAFRGIDESVKRIRAMIDEGASIVDIGGESTRPGYDPVCDAEEISRTQPLIAAARAALPNALLSIDTSKAGVAAAALDAGATIVNDVWGFRKDPDIARVTSERNGSCILMRNGSGEASSGNVIESIFRSWEESVKIACAAGIDERSVILDPGVGFTRSREEDIEILRNLERLKTFGFPVLLGASRKRITSLSRTLSVSNRLETTIATSVMAAMAQVDFARVHDVLGNRRACLLVEEIFGSG